MTTNAAEYWENRYRENGRSWSGNVNASLKREVSGTTPGSALDLGSGEGGDALWLARQGWTVTAVDISPTALAIGGAEQRPGDAITWVAADLSTWQPPSTYDLVTACFLHSDVDLPREEILRRAGGAVAPGGLFLIVGHAGVPHWAHLDHEAPDLPTPDDMLATLFDQASPLRAEDWDVLTSALLERTALGPDGTSGPITDSVLNLRRRR